MKKKQFSGLAGSTAIIIFPILAIMIFLILGSGFHYLIQRPMRASNWDKVNMLSCTRLNDQEVFCKHKHSAIFGLFSENTEFKLIEVSIQKYEGGEDPDEYILHIKTDNEVIKINDYGDDYERAYKTQQLLRSVLREPEISTVKIEYGYGLIKTLAIWFSALFSVGLGIVISSLCSNYLLERMDVTHR